MTRKQIVPGDLFARHQIITGLRELADFLEANPEIPVNEYGSELRFYTREDSDAANVELIDQAAALLGVEVEDRRDKGGHYTAERTFGRVTYAAVHIPEARMREHEARQSYARNIVVTLPEAG